MSAGLAAPGAEPSRDELVAAGEALRRRVEELEQEKRDLEVMLETSTAHADHVSADLVQERDDLTTMLEMTTEHADTVTEELHERALGRHVEIVERERVRDAERRGRRHPGIRRGRGR